MRLKKPFIEMLTAGKTTYSEIASVLGVSQPTAKSICHGQRMGYETARKIVISFGDVPVRQLFRQPFKHFELWLNLPEQQELRNNPSLSPEQKLAIRQSLYRLANYQRTLEQNRKSTRRWRLRQQGKEIAIAA